MPRKKQLPKFKYTARNKGKLFVRLKLPGIKNPVWRLCPEETQEAVDEVIRQIKANYVRELEAERPDNVEEFFKLWQSNHRLQVTERTMRGYEYHIKHFIVPAIGFLDLSEVQPIHIQTLYKDLFSEGVDPATIKATHQVVTMVFQEAVNLDLISKNPAKRAKPPRVPRSTKPKAMTASEIKRFMEAADGDPHKIIAEFALETGMRPQEYLALRWSDIDLEKRTASVVRALVYDKSGGGYEFKETKTPKSRRTIPLSVQLVEKLIEHRKSQNAYLSKVKERLRRKVKPSREYRKAHNRQIVKNAEMLDLVFPSATFTPMKDLNLGRRFFKTTLKKAGLDKRFTLYALRHSCASLLLQANVNPKIVSERLGHSTIAITLQTYSHVLPSMQQDATAALSEVLY